MGKSASVAALEAYPEGLLKSVLDILNNTAGVSAEQQKRRVTQLYWIVDYPPSFVSAFLAHYAGVMQWNSTPVNDLYQYRELGWIPTLIVTKPDARDAALMLVSREIIHIHAYNQEPLLGTLPTPGVVPAAPMFDLEMFHPRLNPTRLLSDERLVRLIWERPDDADSIIAVFSDRGNVEYETLVRILESASPALSEGVL